MQWFTYHIKEVPFVSESCTPTIMSENVRIPTSKKCCSGCWMSNKQPGDLWGSSVVMELFNPDLDRKFQSSLGLAQGKMVKWGISFPPRTPRFLPSPTLREHSLPHVHQLALDSSELPRVKGGQTFPSIHLLCSIPLNTIPTNLMTMAWKMSAQKAWPAEWFSGTQNRQTCSRAPLHPPQVGSRSSQSWHLQDQKLRLPLKGSYWRTTEGSTSRKRRPPPEGRTEVQEGTVGK